MNQTKITLEVNEVMGVSLILPITIKAILVFKVRNYKREAVFNYKKNLVKIL